MPRYRHIKRYRQIVRSVVRHGFGHLLTQLGLFGFLPSVRRAMKNEQEVHRLSRAERLRLLLLDLGPTFVKFGQLLSTRPDLLPRDVLDELSRLQDEVPPFAFAEVVAIIEKELGRPLGEIFVEFAETPQAAASIGQVHFARLQTGEEVVVKVQRPNIAAQMEADLEILLDMARLADRHTPLGRVYRLSDVVRELQQAVRQELDFRREAENAAQIRQNFHSRQDCLIPRVYLEQTSAAVLTMDRVEGIKLSQPEKLSAAGHNPQRIASLLVDTMFEQIFIHGLFHADPHPGNLAVSSNGQLIFMDFGIVGRLRGRRRRQFISFLLGIVSQNPRRIVSTLTDMGILSRRIDRRALRRDVEHLLEKYLEVPIRHIELGGAIREIFSLAFEYNIRIPSDFTLLGKTLMTLEGVIGELAEDVKLIELLKPYAARLASDRLSARALQETVAERLIEAAELLSSLPQKLGVILERTETEGFPIELGYPDLEKFFAHMDRITNRLSFSIVLLSFSIIMAGLIVGSGLVAGITGEALLWRLPIIEAGFLLAGAMAVWLLWAIFRSGKL